MIRAKNQNGVTRKLVHVHVSICAIPFLLSRGVNKFVHSYSQPFDEGAHYHTI